MALSHTEQVERSKYRNWVRGGLGFKYLKDGFEEFANEAVKKEHTRILSKVGHTPGQVCNSCEIGNLKPLHRSDHDSNTGKNYCPRYQANCNCLKPRKKPCPNKLCDAIFEEILDCYDAQPRSPNWRNTDINLWCVYPWEVAKCYINATGYQQNMIQSASDIDIAGLLHLFLKNINLQSHFNFKITGNDVLSRTLKRRNQVFHSPLMELDDNDLKEELDDIIFLLEDEKELRETQDSKTAVVNLKQLKNKDFHITTQNELEICRTAMAAIDTKANEITQTIEEGKLYIEAKCTEVPSVVNEAIRHALELFGNEHDGRIKTLKQSIDTLTERVGKLEIDNIHIKKHLKEIEESKTDTIILDTARCKQQAQIEYLTLKQEVKEQLMKCYEQFYVKTWLSPLKPQDNNIDISDVYVAPKIVIGEDTQLKNINDYHDLFYTDHHRNKKIYVIGNVGAGKSAFCKRMVKNWCIAVSGEGQRNITTNQTPRSQNCLSSGNIAEMGRFEFLFYIPLRCMSGTTDIILEMVEKYYHDIIQRVGEIFARNPEQCLVIADGVDEWKPPLKGSPALQHITYGLPNAESVKGTTIIVTSRPSASGILNMHQNEYDLKANILGVYGVSVYTMIENYMGELNKSSSMPEFENCIRQSGLSEFKNNPLLLQQMIWIYCLKSEIGKSACDLYSSILNIIFGWLSKKGTPRLSVNITEDFKNMQLPEALRTYPRCKENQTIIFLLGQLAFEALVSDGVSAGSFGRSRLEGSIPVKEVDSLLKTGLICETKCFDPTLEDTKLEFTHMSMAEYFIAVYISGQGPRQPDLNLKKLFQTYNTAKDIMHLLNLLKMVSGLEPSLIIELFLSIKRILSTDKNMLEYRQTFPDVFPPSPMFEKFMPSEDYASIQTKFKEVDQGIPFKIQCFAFECLSACKNNGMKELPKVSISDVAINEDIYSKNESLIEHLEAHQVLSLNLHFAWSGEPHSHNISKLLRWMSHLSMITSLKIANLILPCEQIISLSLCLAKASSLEVLELDNVKNEGDTCGDLILDLSMLTKLTCLSLKNIEYISLRNFQRCQILSFSITFCSLQHSCCKSIASFLSDAQTLKSVKLYEVHCHGVECKGHTIDFFRHKNTVILEIIECTSIYARNFETDVLKTLWLERLTLPHDELERLRRSLATVVSVETMHLRHMYCQDSQCSGHAIDMSNDIQLKSLVYVRGRRSSHCFLSRINTTNVERAIFSCIEVDDIELIRRAPKLRDLTVNVKEKYTKQVNETIQTLIQLECVDISFNNVEDGALFVTRDVQSLKFVTLYNLALSLETLSNFLESINALPWSIRIEMRNIMVKSSVLGKFLYLPECSTLYL